MQRDRGIGRWGKEETERLGDWEMRRYRERN
jgi:hypothetical protein